MSAAGVAVGLVGCGSWGKNILRDLRTLGCEVAVADVDPAARARALAQGATRVFETADGLPACHGYVVAVPIPDLAPVSGQLLRRGQPVFSEKTLCMTLEAADELARLDGDRRLFAMHKWRYHPGVDALRRLGTSGELGAPRELLLTRYAWVPDFHGGDVFFTQAVHDLTIVLHVLGRIPPVLHARAGREGDLPVTLTAVLEDERARVVVTTSGRQAVAASAAHLRCEAGAAALPDPYAAQVQVRDAGGARQVTVDTTFPLLLELREFVAHLQGGPAPRCTLAEAREVTRALLALRRAAGICT